MTALGDSRTVAAPGADPASAAGVADAFVYEAGPARVRFGAGALDSVPEEAERLGAARVLLVAGQAQEAAARRLEARLGGALASTLVGVRGHVPAGDAEAARARALEEGADCVVALGGGSAIGLAKAVALTSGLPVVAVPTTYAGSEMTPIWGITRDGRKQTGQDARVLPRTVVYDPELTLSLPLATSVASGLNAAAHCVEALWTERANPLSALVAEEGLRTLAAGLRAVARDPGDLGARAAALRGAWLGGIALATAGTGLQHKLCHVLGGAFDLPHAELHAVLLPHVSAFLAPAAPPAAAAIARALRAEDAAEGVFALARSLGAPSSLAELGFPPERLDEAVALAEAVAPARPRPASADDLRSLLSGALAGHRAAS